MSEELDKTDDAGLKAASGIRQIAAAACTAPGETAEAKELARRVLGAITAAEALGATGRLPGEIAGTAEEFNRMMDAVLDAANRSHGARERVTRRVRMAEAIEREGLVLLGRDELARLFADRCELGLARARIEALEKGRTDVVIAADVGCGLSPLEAIAALKDQIDELDKWPAREARLATADDEGGEYAEPGELEEYPGEFRDYPGGDVPPGGGDYMDPDAPANPDVND